MEANKKFSYKAKLANLTAVGDHVAAIRNLLVELSANESRSADPNHGDFYEINTHVDDLESMVDQLLEEVEPMAFFEKKSA